MPWAPKRPCLTPGCPGFAAVRGRCEAHARQQGIRPGPWGAPSSGAGKRLRGAAWMKIRQAILAEEPTCAYCGRPGQPDDVIDHVRGLAAGGTNERGNLRRSCRRCNELKRRNEARR